MKQLMSNLKKLPWQLVAIYRRRRKWHKFLICLAILLGFMVGGMYGIARWYIKSEVSKPQLVGTSFIPAYAESLGLNPQATMQALIDDLHVKHFRLVSYWDQLEPSPGVYDFSLLDWQFAKAAKSGADVSLSVGLRQPRWPECHMPDWAQNEPASVWQSQLEAFMTKVVKRYKNSPALVSYQVENEFFLQGFGKCTNFDRSRLVAEYDLVKKLDPKHMAIVARSNNAIGWPEGAPRADEYGISIYKRVWDADITHRYLEYPYPAWYYAFVAGWTKIITGKDTIIHELQAEAWPPNSQPIQNTSLAEQNKSFDAARFTSRVRFGRNTGMPEIYLWGSEYWYYRLVTLHDPSLWNVAKQTIQSTSQ